MKTLLLTLAIFLTIQGVAQKEEVIKGDSNFTWDREAFKYDPNAGSTWEILPWEPTIVRSSEDTVYKDRFIMLSDIEAWIEHCQKDTIETTSYEDQFIIDYGNYREMVSIEQLEKRGYKFAYRWIVSTDPWDIRYYFVKDPNDPVGLVKFLKEKK
ncbi:hypothetical protein KAR91_25625 [Candidatus Pacearchaeota archaeon]|nr:hypothetical protein [Candidatus Pacearchaeota archaeon]